MVKGSWHFHTSCYDEKCQEFLYSSYRRRPIDLDATILYSDSRLKRSEIRNNRVSKMRYNTGKRN